MALFSLTILVIDGYIQMIIVVVITRESNLKEKKNHKQGD